MGGTQSKPRLRRSRRFSSLRKRQAPEGSNDPETVPNETTDPWRRNYHAMKSADMHVVQSTLASEKKFFPNSDTCYSLFHTKGTPKVRDTTSCVQGYRVGPQREDKSSCLQDVLSYSGLKVDLPPTPDNIRRRTSLKSKTLPVLSNTTDLNENSKSLEKTDEEWTITLYEIDKMSGRVPREDMVRLMSSIYDAVDNKVGESPQGRKTVRVRLSVTPESRCSTKNPQRNTRTKELSLSRDRSNCQCPDCPKTEPPARKISSNSQVRRHRSDISPMRMRPDQALDHRRGRASRGFTSHLPSPVVAGEENADRRRHYAKLEGVDNGTPPRFPGERSGEQPISELRPRPSDAQPKPTKPNKYHGCAVNEEPKTMKGAAANRRARHMGPDHRNVMMRTRRKDPRFASPYDQHFQEAMYIRLRELQRQGAHEARKATGAPCDSDEADQEESDFEYENNKKTVTSVETGHQKNEPPSLPPDACALRLGTDDSSSPVTNVHHHYHYHHGLSPGPVLSAICSDDTFIGGSGDKSVQSPSLPPKHGRSSAPPQKESSNKLHHHHYHHHYHHTNDTNS